MKEIEILLVEDSPEDIDLTLEAFSEAKLQNNISVVHDGVEAMDFLHKRGKYAASPTPELILLDLNMPRKDGRQVLAEMKAEKGLMHIPVIVLTTSKSDEDVMSSYEHYANCYITKPVDFNEFLEVVRALGKFWFSIVKLPSVGR
ncbi:MAG: response regulator [Flavobacteriales bacterium]|nr:response regulator [Flavobacteriales bacterium]